MDIGFVVAARPKIERMPAVAEQPSPHPDRVDLSGLDGARLLDELESATRELARAQARQVEVLAALAANPPSASVPGCEDKTWVREEVSAHVPLMSP